MNRLMTKPTKWHVCPAKTQISLGIRLSVSSLGAYDILLVLSWGGSNIPIFGDFSEAHNIEMVII